MDQSEAHRLHDGLIGSFADNGKSIRPWWEQALT